MNAHSDTFCDTEHEKVAINPVHICDHGVIWPRSCVGCAAADSNFHLAQSTPRKLMRIWAHKFRSCVHYAKRARQQLRPERADRWLIEAGRNVERAIMARDGGAQ